MTKTNNQSDDAEVKKETNPLKRVEKRMIYIGPGIPGVVRNNTVLLNGPGEKLKGKMTAYPELSGLLIPLNDLAQAQGQIIRKQGMYYSLFKKAENDLKEEHK